jgi:hypothetical protein
MRAHTHAHMQCHMCTHADTLTDLPCLTSIPRCVLLCALSQVIQCKADLSGSTTLSSAGVEVYTPPNPLFVALGAGTPRIGLSGGPIQSGFSSRLGAASTPKLPHTPSRSRSPSVFSPMSAAAAAPAPVSLVAPVVTAATGSAGADAGAGALVTYRSMDAVDMLGAVLEHMRAQRVGMSALTKQLADLRNDATRLRK